jgi:plasmid stability protein
LAEQHFPVFVSFCTIASDIIDIRGFLPHIQPMTALLVRRIDDKLKRALRLRAAENGRSMEEEVRRILRFALDVPSPEDQQILALEEVDAANKARAGGR